MALSDEAYPDFKQPESAFIVLANVSYVIQLKPVPPVSFNGATPVGTALTKILQGSGFSLENNGVQAVLSNPYFPGTVWQQALAAVKAAGAFGFLDTIKNVFAIWPEGGSRTSAGQIIVSSQTGMIGYPEFQQLRIKVRIRFDPKFMAINPGLKIQVQSQLGAANGAFTVNQVSLNLSSEAPGGPWEMVLECTPQSAGA